MSDTVPENGKPTVVDASLVRSAVNTARVLSAFGDQSEWGVTELARVLGMTKSAVHRLLHTLVSTGFLARGDGPGSYTLGIELVRIAWQAERRNPLVQIARPYLRDLAQRTGDSMTLAVLRDHKGLYADIVEGTHQMRFAVSVGDELQLHAGAGGKVLLAFQPADVLDEILSGPLAAYTPETITDPDRLRPHLHEVRRRGYAYSNGEVTPGTRSIAAPVLSGSGSVVAALIVTALEVRIPVSKVAELSALVCVAAGKLSTQLGYQGELGYHGEGAS